MSSKRLLVGLAFALLAVGSIDPQPVLADRTGYGAAERRGSEDTDYTQMVVDKGGKKMTDVQIKELFVATVRWEFTAMVDARIWGTMTFNPDGTSEEVWHNPKKSGSDVGKWHLEGDQVCFGWKRFGGDGACRTMYQISPTEFALLKVGGEDGNWIKLTK